MNIFKNLFLKKQSVIDNEVNYGLVDQYGEIARLVKEARIQKNITIRELSGISKIPEQTIILFAEIILPSFKVTVLSEIEATSFFLKIPPNFTNSFFNARRYFWGEEIQPWS